MTHAKDGSTIARHEYSRATVGPIVHSQRASDGRPSFVMTHALDKVGLSVSAAHTETARGDHFAGTRRFSSSIQFNPSISLGAGLASISATAWSATITKRPSRVTS